MNKLKRLSLALISAIICIFSAANICAVSSPDQSVLTVADDKFEPLYTTSPDNGITSSDFLNTDNTSKNYTLFYTQTTFLALLAGYLIIFKVKGIDHSQKMHRRQNNDAE